MKITPQGHFGIINMLAPRPESGVAETSTHLKFEFVNGDTLEPIKLPLTYLTFYDFDRAK